MRPARLFAVAAMAMICAAGSTPRGVEPPRRQSLPPVSSPRWAMKELRAGIIGTDTSHVPALTKIFRSRPEWKITVVAAFKGGSPDLPLSANRLDGFARTIRDDYGVELVDSIDALLQKVDVVLLESVDGRTHLAQVTPVLKAGKRVFIDKPLAASLEDARRIVQLSRDTRTPFFSTSSTRFHPDIPRLRDRARAGKITSVHASYVLNPLPFHPDLFFYGVHGVEALYAVMGTGCLSVSRRIDGDDDVSTCTWKDGRVGVYRGLRTADPAHPLLSVTGVNGTVSTSGAAGYEALALAIAEFFHTGRSPVDVAQTLEVFEFMTAAQLSKERGGGAVPLSELRIVASPDEWLGFRGTNGTGVAAGAAALPVEFGPGRNLAWKADVPFARSSPVVTRDRVFLTASAGDKLVTLALDPRTGRTLWRREVTRARRMAIYKGNDPASPSPVSDGTNVYVFFAELGLISYTADGQERWRLPLGPFESFYGMGGSPVVSGDTLVLVCDQRRDSFIVAVDTRNGRVRWRKSRSNPVEAFTTPVVHTPVGGAAQVIVFGSPLLEAYALADGARLWWVRRVGSYPVGVPALTGDMVFVSSQGADEPTIAPFDAARSKFDTNRDGLLQAAEMRENPDIGEHFGWMDRNGNGSADRDEYDFVRASMASGHGLTAVRLRPGTGDVTASHVAWQIKKQYPYMPAPLFYDGVLYTVKTGGIVLSIHPDSGDVFKMGRLDGAPGGYVSSPVAGDGKLFMVSAECKVSVVRAARQWELLAVNDLDDECWATPAIASGRIFLRTRRTLYAFAQTVSASSGRP